MVHGGRFARAEERRHPAKKERRKYRLLDASSVQKQPASFVLMLPLRVNWRLNRVAAHILWERPQRRSLAISGIIAWRRGVIFRRQLAHKQRQWRGVRHCGAVVAAQLLVLPATPQ